MRIKNEEGADGKDYDSEIALVYDKDCWELQRTAARNFQCRVVNLSNERNNRIVTQEGVETVEKARWPLIPDD